MARTIVLIDDEPELVEMLAQCLKMRNFEVHSANAGKEGLDLVRKVMPDAVICDLMMPGMSGLEVCRQLRSDPQTKSIPLVVISALGSQSDKPEEFWAAGLKSDDFISKPFETDELLGRLEYVLRKDQYVSTQRPATEEEKKIDLREAPPEDVVRIFIESWNDENFASEYQAMDASLTGGLNANEYMARRRTVFLQENGRSRKQILQKVIRQQRTAEEASIVCERKDVANNRPVVSTQEYKLRKTAEGWKICGVRNA